MYFESINQSKSFDYPFSISNFEIICTKTILINWKYLCFSSYDRFRNDEVVDHSYTTSGRESRNVHTFVAQTEDNKAKYKCEARNEMSVETMTAQIVLSVHCEFSDILYISMFLDCTQWAASWASNFCFRLFVVF